MGPPWLNYMRSIQSGLRIQYRPMLICHPFISTKDRKPAQPTSQTTLYNQIIKGQFPIPLFSRYPIRLLLTLNSPLSRGVRKLIILQVTKLPKTQVFPNQPQLLGLRVLWLRPVYLKAFHHHLPKNMRPYLAKFLRTWKLLG